MRKVYVETTIIGYLTSAISRDLATAGHQESTKKWWKTCRHKYHLFSSELVSEEAASGDKEAAKERLKVLRTLNSLSLTLEAERLAETLLKRKAFPPNADGDAYHLAIAAVQRMDYLLTWNCKHLANASMRGLIERVCKKAGFRAPIICTPEELFGE